jgi:hypothetical protein
MTAQEILAWAERIGLPIETDRKILLLGPCRNVPRELIAELKAHYREIIPLVPVVSWARDPEPAPPMLMPAESAPAPRQADLFPAGAFA